MITLWPSTGTDGDLHLVGGRDVFDDGVNGLQSDVITEGLHTHTRTHTHTHTHKVNHQTTFGQGSLYKEIRGKHLRKGGLKRVVFGQGFLSLVI